uniref:HNH endonuclease signature motif containing protein n=1 Tax=Speluncibacter jeojiensis TaxID=2710754 RepID=UPI0038CDABAE
MTASSPRSSSTRTGYRSNSAAHTASSPRACAKPSWCGTGAALPGCGRPAAWTDAHHIVHWANGGPTDLANMVLLCRYHHRLIHHSEWDVIMGPDGYPWFLPPRSRDPDRQPIPAHGRTVE